MEPIITLTWIELRMAACVGIERRIESKKEDRKGRSENWDYDIDGAAAELAYCKYINERWSGSIGTFKKPDHGRDIQIRHTKSHYNQLIVRPGDNPNHRYVLITGDTPVLIIRGWMWGHEAKKFPLTTPNKRELAHWIEQQYLTKFEKPYANLDQGTTQ